jgi:hypothetical protein
MADPPSTSSKGGHAQMNRASVNEPEAIAPLEDAIAA